MDGDNLKRKRTFRQQQPSRKHAKTDDGGGGLKSGFGAKMLAKMGYKGTGGLGSDGSGIAEPIQVQLRGTKGGVGAVSEKSEQQKREERRKAEANGEKYMDSSEEERAERKKKAKAARATAATRPKKTLFELEASGMHVPLALQSIVDATTGESTPTAGVRLRGADVPFESALQARVRRDLNSFSEAFEELQLESKAIPPQEDALHQELDALEKRIKELEDIGVRLQSLRSSTRLEDVCDGLKDLHDTYPSRSLHRESVSAIHPHFSKTISSWSPLEDGLESVAASLSEVIDIIQPRGKKLASQAYTHPSDSLVTYTVVDEDPIRRGYSSPYETMLLKMWLPTVSSAVTQWDVTNPYPLVHLMEVWQPLLPVFVAKRVLDQVTRKLSTSVHDWNPRKFKKSPHTWIIEWLPYLTPADLDSKGSGLVAEVKRKLRHAFQSIDLSKGPLPGMEQWKKVFGGAEFERLLTSHLVPRLATYLRDNFEVNPAEQDLAPLEAVFAWKEFLPASALAEILRVEFFSKFLEIIHQWMSSEAMVHEEVLQWLKWWRELFGEDLNAMPSVASAWDEAYTLVNQALDLGDARMTDLPAPRQEPTQVSPEPNPFSKSINKEPPRPAQQQVEETTFRDVVEEFCAEENLLLIPLREAHETTGLPLFRITASASGRGGAVVYIKGDVLWAQNRKDKSIWEPIGLDEGLVNKAEGK